MSGNFTFHLNETRMFDPDIFFLINSQNSLLRHCQGNLNLYQGKSGKCQGIFVDPKCMDPGRVHFRNSEVKGIKKFELLTLTTLWTNTADNK